VQGNSKTTHLEYSNSVWMPRRKRAIITMDNVQRRATKLVLGLCDIIYHDRLTQFNLPTLVYRRPRGDMIGIFKMVSEVYDEQVMPAVVTAEECFYQTRGHSYKLLKSHNKTLLRQHYFRERITDSWNSLPDKVVEAPSIQSFERRLDKHWMDECCLMTHQHNLGHSVS